MHCLLFLEVVPEETVGHYPVIKFDLSLQNNHIDKVNKPTFLINLKTQVNTCIRCTTMRSKPIFIKCSIAYDQAELIFQNGSSGDSGTSNDVQFACTQEQLQVHTIDSLFNTARFPKNAESNVFTRATGGWGTTCCLVPGPFLGDTP